MERGVGGGGGPTIGPAFLGSEIMNLLGFCRFSAERVCVRHHGVCMGQRWTSAAVCAMLAVLATSMTPWYPLSGVWVARL